VIERYDAGAQVGALGQSLQDLGFSSMCGDDDNEIWVSEVDFRNRSNGGKSEAVSLFLRVVIRDKFDFNGGEGGASGEKLGSVNAGTPDDHLEVSLYAGLD
jgi:hypothetical protein